MKRPSRESRLIPRFLPFQLWIVIAIGALVLSSCSSGGTSDAGAKTSTTPTATAAEQSAYPGSKLNSDTPKAPVGATVTMSGSGFPANTPVAFTWQTYDGRFVLEQEQVVFVGPRYDPRLVDLANVTTDASGALRTSFTVPEDFGGVHDIVARIDGKFATKMGFVVDPTFSVSSTSGAIGDQIQIHATGLGYKAQTSLWEVSWDNGFTGYMTAVTTHGTALAQIRLAGPAGPHVLKIWRNYRGIPYLNPQQGPFGALLEPTTFVINVKDATAQTPVIWTDPNPADTVQATPDPTSQGSATLSVTPDKGSVGSQITVTGGGFAANQPVNLTWATRSGQKITSTGLLEGFDEELTDLPVTTAGPDGTFTLQFKALNDYAGPHRITATSGDKVAESYFSIYASVADFTAQAKVGQDVTIHMKGVGWTIQGKTYAVVYDNVYLGYGCSFSTKGDIDIHLPAAGAPGVHIIDLYPAVYEGQDPTPNIYSKPDLTYLHDHPGGALPAFHFTLTVTD